MSDLLHRSGIRIENNSFWLQKGFDPLDQAPSFLSKSIDWGASKQLQKPLKDGIIGLSPQEDFPGLGNEIVHKMVIGCARNSKSLRATRPFHALAKDHTSNWHPVSYPICFSAFHLVAKLVYAKALRIYREWV